MFADRRAAGRELSMRLQHLRQDKPLVLALPRGGVPVGFEIAEALDAELDVLLVRKIGVPWEPELALGAVVDGTDPQVFINEDLSAGHRGELHRKRDRTTIKGDRAAPADLSWRPAGGSAHQADGRRRR